MSSEQSLWWKNSQNSAQNKRGTIGQAMVEGAGVSGSSLK